MDHQKNFNFQRKEAKRKKKKNLSQYSSFCLPEKSRVVVKPIVAIFSG